MIQRLEKYLHMTLRQRELGGGHSNFQADGNNFHRLYLGYFLFLIAKIPVFVDLSHI
jgi:hypothetical protein